MLLQVATNPTMKPLTVIALLVTLLILGHVGHAFQKEYFVKPNESTPCPTLPCHTLSYYLENTTRYFRFFTRINFLQGVHEINKSGVLLIQNVFNLTLTGYKMTGSNTAKFVCMQPATLRFSKINILVINHLSVLYCGYPFLQFANEKELSSAALYFLNVKWLKLSNMSVENSTGYEVVGVNILGNSSISHSRFIFSNYYTVNSTNCSYGLGSCKGGNMYLFYETEFPTNSVMSIDSCVFRNGVDISEESSGLSICFYNTVQGKVDDLAILSTGNKTMRKVNSLLYSGTILQLKKASSITGKPSPLISTTKQTLLAVHISNSKFFDNIGGGVNIELYTGYTNTRYQVFIKKCSFQRNLSPIGSSLRTGQPIVLPSKSGLEVLIRTQTSCTIQYMQYKQKCQTQMVSMLLLFMN